ncbi:MAG: PEP-CTERM sorting domain-containing protein [Verrucomicrobiia bacterium]
MSIKHVRRYGLFVVVALSFLLATATFADVIVGSKTAAFQNWTAADLDQDGKPFWDNVSMDGNKRDVGYYLINAPTAPLSLAPGILPYWGNAYNSATDSGGTADPSFYFQNTGSPLTATLELEVAGNENINQFGWYDTAYPLTLHPIFLGPDSPPDTTTFSPSAHYGFYLTSAGGTFFTQSSLNPCGDTSHQHFAVFEQSMASGAETYWIGIEDLTLHELNKNEGCVGDYNDMLVRICTDPAVVVPEPSTASLAVVGLLLMLGLLHRRRR